MRGSHLATGFESGAHHESHKGNESESGAHSRSHQRCRSQQHGGDAQETLEEKLHLATASYGALLDIYVLVSDGVSSRPDDNPFSFFDFFRILVGHAIRTHPHCVG
ncbi:hypothetical protein Nepgr_005236 [Nepenthes gracilis]|uniref:Uncharacterized protein n=1 Tax=Nepenthes gracilis TaxID=150966 RepID=A0AAD3S2T9_NEPGR|nr:hypothetical protein Nepgr_005236 [Nepenthes gracilis]